MHRLADVIVWAGSSGGNGCKKLFVSFVAFLEQEPFGLGQKVRWCYLVKDLGKDPTPSRSFYVLVCSNVPVHRRLSGYVPGANFQRPKHC